MVKPKDSFGFKSIWKGGTMKGINIFMLIISLVFIVGCSNPNVQDGSFDYSKNIEIIQREEGSGTRQSLEDILKEDDKEFAFEKTIEGESVVSTTERMLLETSENQYKMGYVSLGAVDSLIKTLRVNGIMPSKINVTNNKYPFVRELYLLTNNEATSVTKDFIGYCTSIEGQEILEEIGFVCDAKDGEEYTGSEVKGKVRISGSTTAKEGLEKLKNGYKKHNSNVEVEINVTDSKAGIKNTKDGISDIGVISYEYKEDDLKSYHFAKDGVAIIVNQNNPFGEIKVEQVREIFGGKKLTWDDIK